MADSSNRRRPVGTVGQRMRDFSRSVMRHYAPSTGDSDAAAVPYTPMPPAWSEPLNVAAEPSAATVAPLPFDAPVVTPVAAESSSLLQLDRDEPALEASPQIQRSASPAPKAEPGNIALGPDNKPLMYKGQPIPIDNTPTPPALKGLMELQRKREAEIQRLKDNRIAHLSADMPQHDDSSDAPRSTRIRRRGSAEFDYIQTKALADKREPGDTTPHLPPQKPSAPREPHKPPTPSSESDDDASEGDTATASPDFAAPSVISPQRDFENPASIVDHTPADFAVPPVQRAPADVSESTSAPTEAPVSSSAPPVQRASESLLETPDIEPSALPAHQTAARTVADNSAPAIQRATDVNVLPFDAPAAPPVADNSAPAIQRATDVSESKPAPTEALVSPSVPPVQRASEIKPDIEASALPFDTPTLPPVAADNSAPAIQRAPDVVESTPAPTDAPISPGAPPVQRASEITPETTGIASSALPFDAPSMPSVTDNSAPAIQRAADVSESTPTPTEAPVLPSAPPTVQRMSESLPEAPDIEASGLPFDAQTAPPVAADTSAPAIQRAAEIIASTPPPVDAPVSSSAPPVQRASEITSETNDLKVSAPPFDAPSMPPVADNSAPAIQRVADVVESTSAPTEAPVSPSAPPVVQRLSESLPETTDIESPALPFDAPSAPPVADNSAPAIQRAADVIESTPAPIEAPVSPSMPPVQRASEITPETMDIESSALPFDAPTMPPVADNSAPAIQRAADVSESKPAPTEAPVSSSAPPVVQRLSESLPETTDIELSALPFDAPSAPPVADNSAPAIQRAADVSESTPAPVDAPVSPSMPSVQRASEIKPDIESSVLPFDTPTAPPIADNSASAIHRAADVSESKPAPVDAPVSSSAPPVQRASESLPEAPVSPSTMPVQRMSESLPETTDIESSALPFDTPSAPPVADNSAPAIQRAADVIESISAPTEAPVLLSAPPVVQRASESLPETTDIESSALPFDAPTAPLISDSSAPAIQRAAADVNESTSTPTDAPVSPSAPPLQRMSESLPEANDNKVSGLPFDAPTAPPVTDNSAPAIQRVADVSESKPAPTEAPVSSSAPPVVQRASESLPETNDSKVSALPFDAPTAPPVAAENSAPAIQRAADVAESIPAPTEAPVSPSMPPVQRASEITPETNDSKVSALPFDAPSMPSDIESSVLPFDDLNIMRAPSPRVQRATAATVDAASALPFDILPDMNTQPLQRSGDEGEDTPQDGGQASPASQRMDVFQALVAAGMVARPSGPASPPPSPMMQRSPSREAYLMQREIAQNHARRDAHAPVSGTLQRALGEDPENVNEPVETSSNVQETQAPPLDVDQLAKDVLQVLRGKLRNELDRKTRR